jgi:hypothetical protein
LPPAWDEDRVRNHLKKFGKIEKVELARNMPAAKRTDFGFITFDSHKAAVACVDGVNNAELGEGDRKVCRGLFFDHVYCLIFKHSCGNNDILYCHVVENVYAYILSNIIKKHN